MNTLSISLGLSPFIKPIGRSRKITAPEMISDSRGNAIKPEYHGLSGAEISKLIRAKVIAAIDSGNAFTADELAMDIDASVSAARIHLVALAKLGQVEISKITVNGVRAYSYAKTVKTLEAIG